MIEITSADNTIFLIIGIILEFFVIILALFGDRIKKALWGPKLVIEIPSTKYNEFTRANGNIDKYYLFDVVNKRKSSANRVQVILDKIYEKDFDMPEYKPKTLNFPLLLTWQIIPEAPGGYIPVINTKKTITYLSIVSNRIQISAYFVPKNSSLRIENNKNYIFQIHIESNEYVAKPYFLSFSFENNDISHIVLSKKIANF